MPKRVRWLPNERVDLTDLEYGTVTFPLDIAKHITERIGLDNFARVVDGFRVQVTAPLTITVHNGVAWDRSGQLVNSEDAYDDALSITLGAGGPTTHFVEVKLTLADTDTEDRAFWDSTYDNGTDTSGDELPDGREFKFNVATRQKAVWSIETNTTAFSYVADPNTLMIPIATVYVDAGAITGSFAVPHTVLKANTLTTDTVLKCMNVREFPESVPFNIRVTTDFSSYTDKVVTTIDKENGLLTLSTTIGTAFKAGEARVKLNAATPAYIQERTSTTLPASTSVTTEDGRPRYFQGDDDIGYALLQHPYSITRSDLNISNEKHKHDAVASMIRELKFGGLRSADVGINGPPTSFSAAPRYYDNAGSVMGARTNTVSVGDGVNSWGDFNVTQLGTAKAALDAAVAAIPTGGGILYLKKGTYDVVNTTVTIGKDVSLVGDGVDATIIRATGTAPAITFSAGNNIVLRDLTFSITSGSGATYSVVADNDVIYAENCYFTAAGFGPTTAVVSTFISCFFFGATNHTIALIGGFSKSSFTNCEFNCSNDASSRALKLSIASSNTNFDQCRFITALASPTYLVEITAALTNVNFTDCTFTGVSGTSTRSIHSTVALTGCKFDNCSSDSPKGMLKTTVEVSNLRILNTSVSYKANIGGATYGVELPETGTASDRVFFDKCYFTQTTGDFSVRNGGIYLGKTSNFKVTENRFYNCQFGLDALDDWRSGVISKNEFEGASNGISAIVSDGNIVRCRITDNQIHGYAAAEDQAMFNNTGICGELTIRNNIFYNCLDGTSFYGIHFDNIGASIITENIFDVINTAAGSSTAIDISYCYGTSIINNTIENLIGSATGNAVAINVIGDDTIKIDGNNIKEIGQASNIVESHAIRFEAASDDCFNISISNNQIYKVQDGTSDTRYIYTTEGPNICNISNNIIQTTDITHSGIYVSSGLGDGFVKKLTISNNNISADVGELENGIRVAGLTASDTEGYIKISGNSINGFAGFGIQVGGDNASKPDYVMISDNEVITTYSGGDVYGVVLVDLNRATLKGNFIDLKTTDGADNFAVQVTNVNYLSICSNTANVHRVGASGNSIYIDNADFVTITGNTIGLSNDATGSNRALSVLNSNKVSIISNTFVGTSNNATLVDLSTTTGTTNINGDLTDAATSLDFVGTFSANICSNVAIRAA